MADNLRVALQLDLNTGSALKSAKEASEQIKRQLGAIKVDNQIIDLGDAPSQITDLTAAVKQAQAALADKSESAELQRQAALFQENLRFKRQLAEIDGAGLNEKDAAAARSLAQELNRLNIAKIEQDFREASGAVDQFSAKSEFLRSVLQGLGQAIGQQLTGLIQGAIGGLKDLAGEAVNAAADYERVTGALDKLISTSNVGLNTSDLIDFADKLGDATLTSEEAVLRASRSLLSFRTITGDTFLRTLETAQDLAEVMGGDLEGNIVQLGKALEDPINGLSALSRAGTQFTDSQKEQIRTLVESGNLLEAQTLILDELAKQYGGAGEAAAQGLAGALDTFGENANDIKRAFGEELLPVLTEFVNFLQTNQDEIQQFAQTAGKVTADLLGLLVKALKFGADNAQLLGAALQIVTGWLIAVKAQAALASFTALAAGMTAGQVASLGFSAQLKVLTVSLKSAAAGNAAFMASLLPLLPLLITIAAGVAAIKWAQYVNDLREANQNLDELYQRIDSSSAGALAAAQRTKTAVQSLNDARDQGRQITEEERKDAERLAAANELRLEQLREDLKLAQEAATEGPEQEASKANLIRTTELSIATLEKQNNALRESAGLNASEAAATTQAAEDKRSALEKLNDTFSKRLTTEENYYAASQALTAEALAAGSLTEDQARAQNLEAEQRYLSQRLTLLREKLEELRALQATTTDPAELAKLQDQVLKTEAEIYKTRTDLATKAAEERQRVEQEALKKIERANQEANARIAQAQNDRVIAIRRAQRDGVLSAEEAEAQIRQIQADSAGETVAQKERELAQIQQLRDQGTLSAEEAADRERALITEIGQLNLQRIEAEIAAQEEAKNAAIRAIQEEAQAQERASRTVIANLQRRTALIDRNSAAIQRQNDLLQSQGNLQNALNGLEQARAQTSVDRFSRALEIQRQLRSGEVESVRERQQLERELSALGVNRQATELQILDRRQQEEDRLARLQQDALTAQQTQARAGLDLELRRNDLASRRAVIEAQIAELQAQQNIQAAQAALREAEVTGDRNAIEQARTDLQLAEQSARLASENTEAAREAAVAQTEIATNARQALEAQQEAERVTAAAAEQAREFAQQLERAAAASQQINASGRPVGARRLGGPVLPNQTYLVGEEGPELVVPQRSGYVLTAKQTAALIGSPHLRPQFSMPTMQVQQDPALLKAVRALRADLKAIGRPNTTFQIVNSPNPAKTAVEIECDLLSRRLGGV